MVRRSSSAVANRPPFVVRKNRASEIVSAVSLFRKKRGQRRRLPAGRSVLFHEVGLFVPLLLPLQKKLLKFQKFLKFFVFVE